jgi:hypothetical protein
MRPRMSIHWLLRHTPRISMANVAAPPVRGPIHAGNPAPEVLGAFAELVISKLRVSQVIENPEMSRWSRRM